ncbi:peptide chain release factor N(5)-glutamine methyltransferase [Herminiimonas sp. CN]|uniref:peptide chain release factor N(5)-glutamine methyltransferase n=1 Tax=Herminiimonas sp. CN TaxID=1349818 RepID=UPI0004737F0E|nr:peptide chain release factor N(5)-glutamine methyltransferase [Herminiimonas sp. CN]
MTLHRIEAGCSIGSAQLGSPLDALETRILLMHALGLSRVQLITQSERRLTLDEAQRFAALLQRREAGEPIAYIVGQREFFGLPFRVTPDVLIPRPDTELLVELALQRAPHGARVLDMGTGSGAIAIAIAHSRPDLQLTALDCSAAALAVARQNAADNLPLPAKAVRFLRSDWYGALPADARFDLIVSNPPYIVAGDTHLSQGDLRFEPVSALTDHADGLSALRTIVAGAAAHLVQDGWLLLEHGFDQAAAVRELLIAQGYQQVQSWQDLAGIERVSGGVRPS